MAKLGDLAKDKISGFEGIVLARCEWLYGCVRVTLAPRSLNDGKPVDQQTFDEDQLEVLEESAVTSEKAQDRRGGERDMPPRSPDIR